MKKSPGYVNRLLIAVTVSCVALAGAQGLLAGTTGASTQTNSSSTAAAEATSTVTDSSVASSPSAEPTDYKNWIEVGGGGLITNGDAAQFKKQHQISANDGFGGIQDMHVEQDLGKTGLLSVDGHAVFDNRDYKLKLEVTEQDLGYIRAGYTQYRTWYDDSGGYLPTNGQSFNSLNDNTDMALDRGEAWIELGLRIPDFPEITVRYSHQFRNGQKDSTIWGPTTLTGLSTTRLIVPAYRDINESRDIVTADANKTYGNTELGLGMRFEYTSNKDTLYENRNPGENSNILITQKDNLKSDMYTGHGSSVTRFTDELWLTLGYSYTTLSSDTDGSRIYGKSYDAPFNPGAPSPQGAGFVNLSGGSDVKQNVANINVLWTPVEDVTITPEIRIENDDTNGTSQYVRTSASAQPTQPNVNITSSNGLLSVDEGIEIRYTGIPDWVFYARGDLEQQEENRQDTSNNGYNAAGTPLNLNADTSVRSQKYTVGTNWYPLPRLNFSAQYYHKMSESNNNYIADDAVSLDNQRIDRLDLNTDDVNFRGTWRPLQNLSLVSRYDFQYSTVYSRWKSPTNYWGYGMASELTNHIFTESITWNPIARMYVQGNASYVLNTTHTPASENVTPDLIQDSKNDYWTLGLSSGFALDEKTTLKADCTYYRAADYENNATLGMPYGSDAQEYTVGTSLSRQVSETVRVTLRYGYYKYMDATYGDQNNFEGHLIYASTQVRF